MSRMSAVLLLVMLAARSLKIRLWVCWNKMYEKKGEMRGFRLLKASFEMVWKMLAYPLQNSQSFSWSKKDVPIGKIQQYPAFMLTLLVWKSYPQALQIMLASYLWLVLHLISYLISKKFFICKKVKFYILRPKNFY